jgi:hypothetical protein
VGLYYFRKTGDEKNDANRNGHSKRVTTGEARAGIKVARVRQE